MYNCKYSLVRLEHDVRFDVDFVCFYNIKYEFINSGVAMAITCPLLSKYYAKRIFAYLTCIKIRAVLVFAQTLRTKARIQVQYCAKIHKFTGLSAHST